jgi:hypothetical protein
VSDASLGAITLSYYEREGRIRASTRALVPTVRHKIKQVLFPLHTQTQPPATPSQHSHVKGAETPSQKAPRRQSGGDDKTCRPLTRDTTTPPGHPSPYVQTRALAPPIRPPFSSGAKVYPLPPFLLEVHMYMKLRKTPYCRPPSSTPAFSGGGRASGYGGGRWSVRDSILDELEVAVLPVGAVAVVEALQLGLEAAVDHLHLLLAPLHQHTAHTHTHNETPTTRTATQSHTRHAPTAYARHATKPQLLGDHTPLKREGHRHTGAGRQGGPLSGGRGYPAVRGLTWTDPG